MRPLYLLLLALLPLACAPTAEVPTSAAEAPMPKYVYVTSSAALLYDRPTSDVGKPGLGIGEKLEVVGRKNSFYIIKRNGDTYYVMDSFLKPVPPATPAPAEVR